MVGNLTSAGAVQLPWLQETHHPFSFSDLLLLALPNRRRYESQEGKLER